MNILIAYFSGTGNTRLVATELKKHLILTKHKVELFDINYSDKFDTDMYDRIILLYPVYAFREPYKITEFIKQNRDKLDGKYIVIVATHGGMPHNTNYKVARHLKKSRAILIGSSDILCEDTWTVIRKKWNKNYKSGHPDNEDFARLFDWIDTTISSTNLYTIKYKVRYFIFDIISQFYRKGMLNLWFKRWVKKDKCTSCGICESSCPAKAIELKDGYPVFYKGCYGCYKCINICPTNAIHSFFTKNGIQYRVDI